eukprot:Gb_35216 [translate_table: standard]
MFWPPRVPLRVILNRSPSSPLALLRLIRSRVGGGLDLAVCRGEEGFRWGGCLWRIAWLFDFSVQGEPIVALPNGGACRLLLLNSSVLDTYYHGGILFLLPVAGKYIVFSAACGRCEAHFGCGGPVCRGVALGWALDSLMVLILLPVVLVRALVFSSSTKRLFCFTSPLGCITFGGFGALRGIRWCLNLSTVSLYVDALRGVREDYAGYQSMSIGVKEGMSKTNNGVGMQRVNWKEVGNFQLPPSSPLAYISSIRHYCAYMVGSTMYSHFMHKLCPTLLTTKGDDQFIVGAMYVPDTANCFETYLHHMPGANRRNYSLDRLPSGHTMKCGRSPSIHTSWTGLEYFPDSSP